MTVALVCIGLLGVLLFGLGLAVSVTRARTNRASGFTDDPGDPLYKWVRAHGNTAEYAPMLAVLMWVAASQSTAPWVLWCMGIATFCRYLLVAGLLLSPTLARPHPLRFVGALGTYLTGLALAVAVVVA